MDKNYLPGILWLLGGIVCLVISYSGSEHHLVIGPTNISFGWLALVVGFVKIVTPSEE